MSQYPSIYFERCVQALSQFPGLGKRSAVRLSLWLLKQSPEVACEIGRSIAELVTQTRYCQQCHNISDQDRCSICANPARQDSLLCVVSDVRDVMAIESTGVYKGLYHVLGGVISPLEGISPSQLQIASLIQRLSTDPIEELIFALPTTIEGDTTQFYILRQMAQFPHIRLTTVARGIGVGDDLEYVDELTLGRSIEQRVSLQA